MAHELLVSWLNDAYAMEQSLIPVLENHASDAEKDLPEAAPRMKQHVEETRRHASRVEQCLTLLNQRPSTMKSSLASLMGSVQSVTTGLFRDEPIKNALADYGAEQFEVACYQALIAAALQVGQPEIARLCEDNMREDLQMADWLQDQIPEVVERSLLKAGISAR